MSVRVASDFFLLCLLLVMSLSGCSTKSGVNDSSVPKPTPEVLSAMQTRQVVAERMTIIVPVEFKDAPWQGVDSAGWSFEGRGIKIWAEFGPYGPDAKNYGYEDFKDSVTKIDGQDVRIAMFTIPEQPNLIDPNLRRCVEAQFTVSNPLSGLGISACFENPDDQPLALQIIESIRLVQVPAR